MNGFIKFTSHRQRDKAERLLLALPTPFWPISKRNHFSLRRDCGYGVWWVNGREYQILKDAKVKFTTCSKPWNDFMRCFDNTKGAS